MSNSTIDRRRFLQWLSASYIGGVSSLSANTQIIKPRILKCAAIQMQPKLADVAHNLTQADRLIKQAIKQGAEWIVLPEMFTSAVAFHPDMLSAIQESNGKPFQLMKKHAQQSNVVIGGSFLAREGNDVFNRFFLVFPDGSSQYHNKDQPTYWENCYYKGGNDDGILSSTIGDIGSVLCWELIRSRTAERLLNKVNMVLGASCWWTLPDDVDTDNRLWQDNLTMLQQAPQKMAKMLGVPVIHASHAGKFEGYFSPNLEDVEFNSSYLGESMIVDDRGKILARRSQQQGAGIVMAQVKIRNSLSIKEAIPASFWMPKEMPKEWKESWIRWFDSGQDYYNLITLPYLKTGKIPEFIPKYLR
jgi:predicted amidohydrolase